MSVINRNKSTIISPSYLILDTAKELTSYSGNSWSVSERLGKSAEVGVRVSGQGAWATLEGSMQLSYQRLETSITYTSLKKQQGFNAGVRAFWKWLGITANVQANREEINQAFDEVSKSFNVDAQVNFKMGVTGMFPNVPVDASAFIALLQISSKSGSHFIFSTEAPGSDTGSLDQNNSELNTNNNGSNIIVI